MKYYLYIALLALFPVACKKRSVDPPSCRTAPNTISITDNGTTYCIAGNGMRLNPTSGQVLSNNVAALCRGNDSISFLEFGGDGTAFSISYLHDGPPHGIGVFPWSSGSYATFNEKFPGGHTYNVTGGTVTVTTADSTHVQATFVFNLSGPDTKTITGNVRTTKP